MRKSLNSVFGALFAASMVVFLVLAFTLVIVQFAGLVGGQPSWIDWAAELKQPSILTAVVAGLFGFGAFNTKTAEATATEEGATSS